MDRAQQVSLRSRAVQHILLQWMKHVGEARQRLQEFVPSVQNAELQKQTILLVVIVIPIAYYNPYFIVVYFLTLTAK